MNRQKLAGRIAKQLLFQHKAIKTGNQLVLQLIIDNWLDIFEDVFTVFPELTQSENFDPINVFGILANVDLDKLNTFDVVAGAHEIANRLVNILYECEKILEMNAATVKC